MALRHSASILFTMALPASSSATAPRPATSSRWLSAAAPPAGNKPHLAEKSTPVWLVIWRIWAGFANSQLRHAAFRSIYLYIDVPLPLAATLGCCSDRCKSVGPSAPIAYATSVSPPDEAVAWPGRRCWVANNAAGCPWHGSCKSPRTLQKCKLLITR